jgi:hypothetical protein
MVYDRVLKLLPMHGANPNVATKPEVETGGFMRKPPHLFIKEGRICGFRSALRGR